MTVETQKRRKQRRIWIALAAIVVVLAAVIVPPMISVNRYKNRIAELVSQSLGRPVHLTGVELRLLPWPSFVLSNLVVDEDPAYGAEPVLHAETVTTDVRLLALWRGRLEISQISVDNASLNLVRMPGGHWNLDPLFRTAAAKAGAAASREKQNSRAPRLPYLEATDSRINFKNGVEKLPFSIVSADLSFWEDSPGDWHIRLRGQPARTDVSLFQEDTGVLRLDASLHSAPALRNMPLHLDLEWSEAQLGQLSRLLIGSDPGWRGNLTADLHLSGTPETAHVAARLQAAGVHRAEFAPAEPLDFDANCKFVYHYSSRSVQNLACDSPLGNGHLSIAGNLPGTEGPPDLNVAFDHVPMAAGLAFLRTIRNGIDPDLTASGTASGKLSYLGGSAASSPPVQREHSHRRRAASLATPGPLIGNITIDGFQLSGGPLDNPIRARHIVLEPETADSANPLAISGTADLPAGGASPLILTPRFTLHGYSLSVQGQASLTSTRQFARLAGIPKIAEFDALTGGPVSIAVEAHGPWLEEEPTEVSPIDSSATNPRLLKPSSDPAPAANSPAEEFTGTIALHDATWKPDYLAHSVGVAEATLRLDGKQVQWDPVEFSYGPLKGTASLTLPAKCPADAACPAQFDVKLGKLNAAEVQSAVLGARPRASLLDDLISRLHLSSAPAWPPLSGTVSAAALVLGNVTLEDPTATLKIDSTGAKITSLDADILGGKIHASGSFTRPDTDQGRPAYALEAKFSELKAAEIGRLIGLRFSGGPFDADGKIALAGLTASELTNSAKGIFHFEWRNGTVSPLRNRTSEDNAKNNLPQQLSRFNSLTGAAEIGGGAVILHDCEAIRGGQRHEITAKVSISNPPEVSFTAPEKKVAAGQREPKNSDAPKPR